MGTRRGQQRPIDGSQIDSIMLFFRVDGSAGANAVLQEGGQDGTLVRNGAGDYSITFAEPFARECHVVGFQSETALMNTRIVSKSATAVRVLTELANGNDTDADFDLTIAGWYDPVQR